MKKLNFTPWHGQKYERFNIFIELPNCKKHIGRMIAPNTELALVKARENFPEYKTVHVIKRKDKKSF